jgi:hypothetical protein
MTLCTASDVRNVCDLPKSFEWKILPLKVDVSILGITGFEVRPVATMSLSHRSCNAIPAGSIMITLRGTDVTADTNALRPRLPFLAIGEIRYNYLEVRNVKKIK